MKALRSVRLSFPLASVRIYIAEKEAVLRGLEYTFNLSEHRQERYGQCVWGTSLGSLAHYNVNS